MMKRSHSSSSEDNNPGDAVAVVAQGGAAVDKSKLPASQCGKRAKVDWEALFQRLSKYKGQHGHCSVPLQNEDDPELGIWGKRNERLYVFPGPFLYLDLMIVPCLPALYLHYHLSVAKQRELHAAEGEEKLTEDQVTRLNTLGVGT